MIISLPTRRDTRRLGRALAGALAPGDAIILSGPLGAGKTFFVRGLCRALGLPEHEPVQSPTFNLVRELATKPRVIHADLYRLGSLEEAEQLGLLEQRDAGAVLLAEWAERFPEALGPDCLTLHIELGPRRATLTASGPRSRELLAQAANAALQLRLSAVP
jgi:tRNA threonylcarbamoyladenosine biosynthesis protein TsaE